MRELTLQQIDELQHGEVIPSFRARIAKVWDQKSGEGQYGTWSIQNLIVTDDFMETTLTWTGGDPFSKQSVGDVYLFECSETKHGLKGIVRDIRHVDGKTYEGVKVTEMSKITESTLEEVGDERQPAHERESLSARAQLKTHRREDSPTSSPTHSVRGGERQPARSPGRVASEAVKPFASRRDDPPRADDRSNRIERQHSQEMALRAIALTKQVISTQSLRDWTDYFQRDIGRNPNGKHNDDNETDAE